MKRLLFLAFGILTLTASSQIVNNMVVFCNDAEPFTLILNGERINMTPQTRVRVEGLTLKKYDTKVIFQNPKLKQANTTITFFSSGYECEFSVTRSGKKKYKILYLTDKPIEAPATNESNNSNTVSPPDNNNGNNTGNNTVVNDVSTPTLTFTPTNTVLTGPGMYSNTPSTNLSSVKCSEPMSDARFLNILSAVKELPNDKEKEAKALLMMEGACITVNQLKQLLNSFFSENSKYNFAKQVYERTKDNSDFVKLSETFVDSMVKDKFQKFVQSKK